MFRSCSSSLALILLFCIGGAGGCREPARPLAPATPGALALQEVPGRGKLHEEIAALQGELRQPVGQKAETWARLGRAFVRKARESADPSYYVQADAAAGQALALDKDNHGALQVRQIVLLNGHRFAEARALAEKTLQLHPRDEVAWGALGDSLLELGNYDGAVEAYQQMVDLKPDLRSYSRGAWMRWLRGDSQGAIELMKLAIEAGSPRDPESRAYCRVQLGELYFALGRYDQARGEYDLALRDLPGHAPAQAARGRLNLVTGKLNEALSDLRGSLASQPLTAVRAVYIDALQAAGSKDEAAVEMGLLDRQGPREDPRALSLFYANHHMQKDLAVSLAKQELEKRPDIWSFDAVAWALYRAGKLDDAWIASVAATRLGTRDPRLMFHRGRIAAARGDDKDAVEQLTSALAQSPSWDLREPQEARAILATLQSGAAAGTAAKRK